MVSEGWYNTLRYNHGHRAKPIPFDTKIKVINLARTPERMVAFEQLNRGLVDYERFEAIDGSKVNRQSLVAQNVITADLEYTDGAIGVALSHLTLWQRAEQSGASVTICEDDAIFNRNFPEGAAFLAGTAPTFDIILWGWNMDAALSVKIHGETPTAMAFDQDRMRSGLKHFQGRVIPSILLPLTQAMGLVCYTVSAAGAKKLRERCLPLRPFLLNLPLGRGRLRNVGLDVVLSALYEGMSAFACFPALVVTPNDHARSTTRPSNPPAAKAVDLE